MDSCITSLAVQRLPKHLQVQWEVHTQDHENVPPIEQFLKFVRVRADAVGVTTSTATPTTTPLEQQHEPKYERKPDKPQGYKAAVHMSTPSPTFRYECILCKPVKHPLCPCPKFNGMDLNARIEHLKTHKLCFNCLAHGHRTAECRSYARCKTCSGRHHTLVHQSQPAPTNVTSNTLSAPKSTTLPDILMMTNQVMLKGPGGRTFIARALLDSGSSITLISSKAAQTLQLPTTQTKVTFSGVQDTPVQSASAIVTLSYRSQIRLFKFRRQ